MTTKSSKHIPLPFELISYITGYLKNDRPTLKSCTLTSKAWHAASRSHIFRRITIANEERFKEFSKLMNDTPAVGYWARELRIEAKDAGKSEEDWFYQIPDVLPSKMPKLRMFTLLDYGASYALCSTNFFSKFSKFESIRGLSFINCRLTTSFLKAFVCALPRITYLSIDSLQYCFADFIYDMPSDSEDSEGEGPPPPRKPRPEPPMIHTPRLTTLNVIRDARQLVFPFFDWLKETESMHTLRSVGVNANTRYSAQRLGVFISALDSQVEEFILRMNPRSWRRHPVSVEWEAMTAHINLSSLTQLRRLNLFDVTNPSMIRLLQQIPSPGLVERLAFSVTFKHIRNLKNKDLKDLDDFVVRPEFSSLQEVRFTYSGPLEEDIVTRKLRRVFRAIAERGMLTVVMAGP